MRVNPTKPRDLNEREADTIDKILKRVTEVLGSVKYAYEFYDDYIILNFYEADRRFIIKSDGTYTKA